MPINQKLDARVAIMVAATLVMAQFLPTAEADPQPCFRSSEWSMVESSNVERARQAVMRRDEKAYPADDGPLNTAALFGFTGLVKELLADAALVQREGATALWIAAEMGRTDVTTLLLQGGVDPNATWRGDPAIYEAVSYGNTAEICLLMRSGADVNHPVPAKAKALTAAFINGRDTDARLLLAGGYHPSSDEIQLLQKIAVRTGAESRLRDVLATREDRAVVAELCVRPASPCRGDK